MNHLSLGIRTYTVQAVRGRFNERKRQAARAQPTTQDPCLSNKRCLLSDTKIPITIKDLTEKFEHHNEIVSTRELTRSGLDRCDPMSPANPQLDVFDRPEDLPVVHQQLIGISLDHPTTHWSEYQNNQNSTLRP